MATDSIESLNQFFEWCETALRQLAANLTALGYEFQNKSGPLGLQESDTSVLDMEAKFGSLPIAYKTFYRRFRFVDFSQSDEQLMMKQGEIAGLGLNCPLVFCPLDHIDGLRADLISADVPISSGGRHFLPTGSVASNCEPKGIWVPSSDMNPVLYDDGAGPISFIQELRESIMAGGFPFWKAMFRRRRHISPLGFSPPYPELLPLLLQGIESPPN